MGGAGTTILLGAWAAINGVWSMLIFAQFQLRRRGLLLEPRPWKDANPNADDALHAIRAPGASLGPKSQATPAGSKGITCAQGDPDDPPNHRPTHASAAPPVCIVIPAHNEEAMLATCLRSALAQDYPALNVVVADDRSTDATAAIARRFAEEDARVRVERIAELPQG